MVSKIGSKENCRSICMPAKRQPLMLADVSLPERELYLDWLTCTGVQVHSRTWNLCNSRMRTRPSHLVVVGTIHEALGQTSGIAAPVWLIQGTLLTKGGTQIQALATPMSTAACFCIGAPMW